jgi:DNA-binding transcriptional MocR family regulator
VALAFERLQAVGLVEARPGSGHFIAAHAPTLAPASVELGPAPSEDAALGFVRSLDDASITLPVGCGFLPPSWFAEAIPLSILSRVRSGGALSLPAPRQGDPILRELLVERLRARGVPAACRHILVTKGASQAFDLIARTLLSPGDTVLVDDPGYFVLFTRLKAAGVRLLPVPKCADGSALDVLEDLARTQRPRMFFTQTLLHNPTGISASPANCHGILQFAEKYDFLVAEDHSHSDLASPHLISMAQIDELRRVLYIGSYTKVLSPGTRIGFIAAADACITALLEAKILAVLSGSALEEAVLREVLSSGKYRKYLERLRDRLARYRALATTALKRTGLDVVGEGGLFLWCRLPDGMDALRLSVDARRVRILLANGSMFSCRGSGNEYLRFNAAYASDPLLIEFLSERLRRDRIPKIDV